MLGDETIRSLDEWGPVGYDIVSTLLAELGDEHETMVLVFDDVPLLVDQTILDQLAFFLERAPAWLRTILISRNDPNLPLARWRVRGLLTEIRQLTLALTTAEAKDVLDNFDGLALSDSDTEFLICRTEGWAAALQLAGLSIADRQDATTFLREVLGADRMLFDFVASEILDRLPSDERDAGLALSLLDDIDSARCASMTGAADGGLLLRRLLQRGLPLVPLDAQRQTVRFHQLFRDLVVSELKLRRPDDIGGLHRRAAEAERAAGDFPSAVRHYLAAGDIDAAFGLVVAPVWDLYRAGRTRDAAVWLGQFPDAFVAEDPARILAYAAALSFVGRLDDATKWNERAAPLVVGDVALAAELAISSMVVHLGKADTAAVRADFELLRALRPEPGFDWDPFNRVLTIMAIVALFDGHLDEAASWVAAIEAATSTPERQRAFGRPARQAWLALERGLLADAERFADEALLYAGPELAAGSHTVVEVFAVKARVTAERAQVDEAASWAERAVDLADELGDPLHQAIAREAMVATIEADAGSAEALAALERIATTATLTTELRVRHCLLAAELAARCGRTDAAEEQIVRLPASRRRTLLAARIAADRGRDADVDALLTVDPTWPTGRQIEAELVRHRARPLETTHLRRALELGVSAGFVSTYLREGPVVTADVGRAVWSEHRWRSSNLATALRDRPAHRPVTDDPLVEPLTEKEHQVLQFLTTHLSAIEIARHSFVSVNTLRTHIKGIYRKLGVNTRSDAVRRAHALGLVTEQPHV
jgi:LuxR family maltose regulon positive regulatory protein